LYPPAAAFGVVVRADADAGYLPAVAVVQADLDVDDAAVRLDVQQVAAAVAFGVEAHAFHGVSPR
jgi:hypothetical protein